VADGPLSAGNEAAAADGDADRAAAGPVRGARRDFRLYWLAGAADLLGSHASGLVLPLLVLALGGSPLTAGVLGTAAALGQVALGPVAGVYADRWSRRALMVGAALVAGTAMGAVAIAVATDSASLPVLFVAAVVEGLAAAVYAAAAAGAVRAVLPAAEPERAVGALRAREQGAQLVGPSFGGALYQLAAWAPFLADAVSYLIAAGCVRAIGADLRPRRSEVDGGGPAPERPSFRAEFGAGLRFVWGQPLLRFVGLWAAGVNVIFGALYFHVVLVARLRGASAASIGLILTLAGAAGLVGALVAPRLLAVIRPRTLVVAASWLMAGIVALLALTTTTWVYGLLLGLVFAVSPALSIVFQSRAIMLTPDGLQARVGTALGTVGEGAGVAAPLLAGLLVGAFSPATVALLFGAALAGLALYATANVRHLRPTPAELAAASPAPDTPMASADPADPAAVPAGPTGPASPATPVASGDPASPAAVPAEQLAEREPAAG
jgi:predicted MFS family arabinose efflux permease